MKIDSVTFVGAGNLATRLAIALARTGCRICQVYSRTMESASRLAALVGAQPVCDTEAVAPGPQLVIFAVADKALPDIIPAVARRLPHAVLAHTAGSMPASLFDEHASHYGVLYPMQTFSKQRDVDLAQVPFFIEASDDVADAVLATVAATLSDRVYRLDGDARRRLHLAAVFACNFANHCYALSQQLLDQAGIPFDVMLPLIDETAAKVHVMPPAVAQTGPAVRYDLNVIGAQLDLLSGQQQLCQVYQTMSRSIHALAVSNVSDKICYD